MEAQIHHLEQEAYCAVLRAFKAQSDAITWVFAFSLFACLRACYLDVVCESAFNLLSCVFISGEGKLDYRT